MNKPNYLNRLIYFAGWYAVVLIVANGVQFALAWHGDAEPAVWAPGPFTLALPMIAWFSYRRRLKKFKP